MARDNFEGVVGLADAAFNRSRKAESSAAGRQFATPSEGDASGGNLSGHNPKPWNPILAADFQGKSGQPDNQETHRGPGKV